MEAKIFISGDIVNTKNTKSFIDVALEKLIKEQDYAICNFEAPISGSSSSYLKVGPNISQKKESVGLLKESGFNLFLLANNHMYDYGDVGLMDTISLAKKHKIETIGAGANYNEAYSPIIKVINGIKIAILNASEAQFGVLDGGTLNQSSGYAWINHPLIDASIINLKDKVDKIIVCCHAGLENYPIPLVQWKDRYKVLCDLGADCIIGSHPHIPQGYEVYNKKPIFYSLGNFYFDSLHFEKLPDYSFSVILKITKDDVLFDLIYHYKNESKVKLLSEKDVPFKIEKLNDLINDNQRIEEMYIDAYQKITKKMYASIYTSYLANDTLKEFLKKTIKKFIFSSKLKIRREFLLQHLNRNETYRWLTVTAIDLLNRKKEK
jgi:poly-gamma-glutamate synthesis protein (capsule biosynthesis protein)